MFQVKLLQLLGDLPFLDVYHVTGTCDFQSKVFHSVMLALLGDEDGRVRKAASEAIEK